jgi:hypothetical protein
MNDPNKPQRGREREREMRVAYACVFSCPPYFFVANNKTEIDITKETKTQER